MKNIDNFLSDENEHLNKLHKIVQNAIDSEELILHNLSNPPLKNLTRGQAIMDKVAKFGGSWRFIILFWVVLALWIIFNVGASESIKFDSFLLCCTSSSYYYDESK